MFSCTDDAVSKKTFIIMSWQQLSRNLPKSLIPPLGNIDISKPHKTDFSPVCRLLTRAHDGVPELWTRADKTETSEFNWQVKKVQPCLIEISVLEFKPSSRSVPLGRTDYILRF